jgi:AcrR family transcriptional regulator
VAAKKRKYELKVRAERARQTRERIVEATAALHDEIGPARTTVAEIARRARVQRLTVYNVFPDQQELFAACREHFLARQPFPDLREALELPEPADRLLTVLRDLYGFYHAGERTIGNVERDRALVPALDDLLSRTNDAHFAALVDAIVGGWPARGRRKMRLRAAIAVALDFWTWRRLAEEGLGDEDAAELMAEIVACLAGDANGD